MKVSWKVLPSGGKQISQWAPSCTNRMDAVTTPDTEFMKCSTEAKVMRQGILGSSTGNAGTAGCREQAWKVEFYF